MRKRKISLSLDEKLIRHLDKYVDNLTYNSRSGVIEEFLTHYLTQNRQCVILAGGNPENLWIDELKVYRPLVNLNGKTLIEQIIQKILEINYNNIIIVGSKKVIVQIFDKVGDGSSLGCNIKYIEEKKTKNLGNTLSLAKPFVKDSFLFTLCDHYFDFDLKKLEKIHMSNNFISTIAIYGGARFKWEKTAMVELDGDMITSYWEFPVKKETHLVSTLVGFAEPEIFNYISDSNCSLQSDVLQTLIKQKKLGGAILSGNFVNIHTKKDAELAKKFAEGK